MIARRVSRLAGAAVALSLLAGCDPDEPTGTIDAQQSTLHAALAGSPGTRANRSTRATDARNREYSISYQPDWVREVALTRMVGGAPLTTVLFANPGYRLQPLGSLIRTRIASAEQGLDFEITLTDPGQVVKRIIVETVRVGENGEEEAVSVRIHRRGRKGR